MDHPTFHKAVHRRPASPLDGKPWIFDEFGRIPVAREKAPSFSRRGGVGVTKAASRFNDVCSWRSCRAYNGNVGGGGLLLAICQLSVRAFTSSNPRSNGDHGLIGKVWRGTRRSVKSCTSSAGHCPIDTFASNAKYRRKPQRRAFRSREIGIFGLQVSNMEGSPSRTVRLMTVLRSRRVSGP
jgi:hypothetical protein